MVAFGDFEAFTCACRVAVGDSGVLEPALARVRAILDRVDEACSRFRADSELMRLERSGGGEASPLLASLVRSALEVAERSRGDVVPTLGRELADLGYGPETLFEVPLPIDLPSEGFRPTLTARVLPATSWRSISLDGTLLTLPAGVGLDLGATAKAAAAELCAFEVHAEFGTSVLVSLGGDIATAGPDAWEVLVQDLPEDPASQVSLAGGWAMATSSTQKRRWRSGSLQYHHILDPWTSLPAPAVWRSVSIAAPDCVSANMASTAAVVRGERAVAWLRGLGYPSRLVRFEGGVVELNGWPADEPVRERVP